MTDDQKAPAAPEYTQGVCADGAAILEDGRMLTIEEILDRLRGLPARAVPDGYVILPAKLTAENGAKAALMGEFSELACVECPECEGDDCITCGGEGSVMEHVPVSWTTIKRIHDAVVQHFADRQPEPTSAVPVPDPDWKYDTALIFAAAHHLERVMEEHPYCDHVQVVKHYADIRRKQKAAAAPQQGGGE